MSKEVRTEMGCTGRALGASRLELNGTMPEACFLTDTFLRQLESISVCHASPRINYQRGKRKKGLRRCYATYWLLNKHCSRVSIPSILRTCGKTETLWLTESPLMVDRVTPAAHMGNPRPSKCASRPSAPPRRRPRRVYMRGMGG